MNKPKKIISSIQLSILLGITLFVMSCKSMLMGVTGLAEFYEVSDSAVKHYFWNPMSEKYTVTPVTGADPESFEQLNPKYGRDKFRVYRGAFPIEKADSSSFKLISESYAVDIKHAYINGELLENSDAATFERLGNNWSKDQNNFYYNKDKLDICDLPSFKIIPDKFPSRAIDKQCYYWQAERVEGFDRSSLVILPTGYSKDKDKVFWANILIDGADPFTLKVKKDGQYTRLAKDKNRCYLGPRIIGCEELNEEGKKFCGCIK